MIYEKAIIGAYKKWHIPVVMCGIGGKGSQRNGTVFV